MKGNSEIIRSDNHGSGFYIAQRLSFREVRKCLKILYAKVALSKHFLLQCWKDLTGQLLKMHDKKLIRLIVVNGRGEVR